MAFAITSGLRIEPNMAVYEYADVNGLTDGWRDVLILRHADNALPHYWVDLALGRSNQMPEHARFYELPFVVPDDSLSRSLWLFRFCYSFVLKIVLLELSAQSTHAKMLQFLNWMFDFSLAFQPLVLRFFSLVQIV